MGIRIEHQAAGAAVGMAAYAGGRGKAQERRQKYMLDLLARRQEQFQGFKYQATLQGMRERGAEQRMRQGQLWQGARAEQQHRWQVEGAEKEREWTVADRTEAQQRTADVNLVESLDIPQWASPDDRNWLTNKLSGIKQILYSDDFNFKDPKQRGAFDKAITEFNEKRLAMQPPDRVEQEMEGILYGNPQTGDILGEPGPGLVPFRSGTGKPAFEQPPSPADAKALMQNRLNMWRKSIHDEAERRLQRDKGGVLGDYTPENYDKKFAEVVAEQPFPYQEEYDKMYPKGVAEQPLPSVGATGPSPQQQVTAPLIYDPETGEITERKERP